ncbi:hypothetical protein ACQP2F_18790 [Actinoplanes sp. CA-030573]|uniref:hypothetical protein n=1 Tax=Actinoplanes sp. CA-030573 TaxID=3239898 RepID=UPI003D941B89
MRARPGVRRRAGLLAIAGVALVGVALAAWMTTGGAGDNDIRASVAGLFVGLAALLLAVVDLIRSIEPPQSDPARLADDLAATIKRQWLDEARLRNLRRPQVLPLVWEHRAGDAAPARFRVDGGDAARFETVTRQLARAYGTVPGGRLVVLGEPGAGKTVVAVLLTLGLLETREAGGPLPVLLSASSWDPVRQSWPEWITSTLAVTYYGGDRRVPEILLDDDRIIPVLDGLDEIPEVARRSAVRRINTALGARHPIVLTCRSAEYADVLRHGVPALLAAPVVTVRPVAAADLAAYLAGIDWPAHADWAPVLAAVRERPDGPPALALSTPLMISVARTVYQHSSSGPQELLDETRFGTRHAIEDHLVDGLIGAAFADGRASWPVDAARRWLTFLAAYLHRERERDLAWWRLADHLLSPWTAPAVGLVAGLFFMAVTVPSIVGEQDGPPGVDAGAFEGAALVGAAMAILTTLLWFAGAGAVPSRAAPTLRNSLDRLILGFRAGFALVAIITVPVALASCLVTLLDGPAEFDDVEMAALLVTMSVGVAVVAGIGAATHALFRAPPERSRQATPAGQLRADRLSSLSGAAAAGMVVTAVAMPAFLVASRVAGAAGAYFASAAGMSGVPSPPASTADIGHGALVAAGVGGAAFTVLVLLGRAWPRFVVVRLGLALRKRAPWRLMAFLAEAHRRDLLRESGGYYQFRHIRLQERLAEQAGTATGRPGPTAAVRGRRRPRRRLALVTVVVLVAAAGAVHAMGNHLACRGWLTMGGADRRIRAYGGGGSSCLGVLTEAEWDTLAPPRPPGRPDPGEPVFERLRSGNRRAGGSAPTVLVAGRMSGLDATEYRLLLRQLSGVAVAQATGPAPVRVTLVDRGAGSASEGAVDKLVRRWRTRYPVSAVVTLSLPTLDGQSEVWLSDVSAGEPVDPIDLPVEQTGNTAALSALTDSRPSAAVVAVSGQSDDFYPTGAFSAYQTRYADDWLGAGQSSCRQPGTTVSVYAGPPSHLLEFLRGVRECPTPPPILLPSRPAAARVLSEPARHFAGWTFYFSTSAGTSPVGHCRGVPAAFLDGYRRIFADDPCPPPAGGSVAVYGAVRLVQAACGGSRTQAAFDAALIERHSRPGTAEEGKDEIVRARSDGRAWTLDTIETGRSS